MQSLLCKCMGASGCFVSLRAHRVLGRGHIYPEVDDGHGGTVSPAHNAVEVLQAGGEEGAESASQPNLPGLLEALEVSTPDAAHAAAQWGIQGHQVKLPRGDNRAWDTQLWPPLSPPLGRPTALTAGWKSWCT